MSSIGQPAPTLKGRKACKHVSLSAKAYTYHSAFYKVFYQCNLISSSQCMKEVSLSLLDK